ncbi:hypothetical protein AJ78_06006 [Emergomyces pasteurianus Ep9510]|uniref:FAD-binding PCMH-type domain-containing protein n=1 Tax=Emergomyces pasteurianus Ep9510 TaxID=1447872 RepID=A0A1J9PC49_9EURO|nr:hypothetical protein AJ78_06006 [Emergomyces pasteurianus Ep9510]
MNDTLAWTRTISTTVQAELNGRNIIYLPGSCEFVDSETDYFTAGAREVQSAAVARPTSTADVSKLLKALRRHLPSDVPITVRGAGHATYGGTAKAASGVTIDMRGIRGVSILPSEKAVRIGAGEKWGSVYAALEEHKPSLTAVGGRMPGVGVVGFLLGGGLSNLSPGYGFGADTVSVWEIVLASGEVVRAARDEDTADLWDALRGGSTNFGIITAVEIACFPHPTVFRGAIAFYLPYARQATLRALINMGLEPFPEDGEPINHGMWSITHYLGLQFINALLTTTGAPAEVDMNKFVDIWGRIPWTGILKTTSHRKFVEQQGKLAPKDGARTFNNTITVKMNFDLLNGLVDLWYSSVNTVKQRVSGLMYSLVFQLLSVSMLETSCQTAPSRPPATTSQGLNPKEGPLIVLEIYMTWKNTEDDEFIEKAGCQYLDDARSLARQMGLDHRYIFPNYACPKEKVMKGYGDERLAVLQHTAQKWDPEGFFQGQFVGGFKITK